VKRIFDIFIAIISLIIGSPIFILSILGSILYLGYPIFFVQKRLGYKGKLFKLYKFRTMKIVKDQYGKELDDNLRLTSWGNFLRKTSIDELPTLLNVLKGDMSIVGPRPLLKRYESRYNSFQIQRQNVKPGITGLAQINGRNLLSWDEKFEFDVKYVEKNNLFIDIKIIILTFFKVFLRHGINNGDEQIMEEFMGSKKK
tara:strand:- start:614 stop:1210 length:597 start_codon:yes stop_codon:yes gene_type:complete